MIRATTTRLTKPILWVAVIALLLAAISNHMHVTACIGDCCTVEAIACCPDDAPPTADGNCCECCTKDQEQPRDDAPDSASSTCAPGCCITLAFDIEMAPSTESSPTVDFEPLAGAPTPPAYRASQPRAVIRTRPFDRGPPRIDRRTALRACVVLLI